MGHDRRLRILGELELLVGTFAHQPEQVLAERLVDLVEHVLRGPARIGERRAHADGLASLSGKNECAHRLPCSVMNRGGRLGRGGTIAKAEGTSWPQKQPRSTSPADHVEPRQLGSWMTTALVVGNMIGAGIFLLPASWRPTATTPSTAGC